MRARRNAIKTLQHSDAPPNGDEAADEFYPSSDGKPMAETPEHIDALIRSFQMLQDHYAADANVYIGADMFLYYEEGNRRASVAPDVFVAKGAVKMRYRTSYRLWEEGVPPSFVLELTSPSTTREDQRKAAVYGRIGVAEYVLYNPAIANRRARASRSLAGGLLQGFRLGPDGYELMAVAPEGGLVSHELGLRLVAEGGRLEWYSLTTGQRLLDRLERAAADAAARQAAEAQAATDVEARQVAEWRASAEAEARHAAEARLAELEALLRERRPPPQ